MRCMITNTTRTISQQYAWNTQTWNSTQRKRRLTGQIIYLFSQSHLFHQLFRSFDSFIIYDLSHRMRTNDTNYHHRYCTADITQTFYLIFLHNYIFILFLSLSCMAEAHRQKPQKGTRPHGHYLVRLPSVVHERQAFLICEKDSSR